MSRFRITIYPTNAWNTQLRKWGAYISIGDGEAANYESAKAAAEKCADRYIAQEEAERKRQETFKRDTVVYEYGPNADNDSPEPPNPMTLEEARRIVKNVSCHCDGTGLTPGPIGIAIPCTDCDGLFVSSDKLKEARKVIAIASKKLEVCHCGCGSYAKDVMGQHGPASSRHHSNGEPTPYCGN